MNRFGVDNIRPAVVTIDLQRGHLDPAVATLPVRAGSEARIIGNNVAFLTSARSAGVPVIHTVTQHLAVSEIRHNPFWRTRAGDPAATRKNTEQHALRGSSGCELMPELMDESYDILLDTKRRYDAFESTDLAFVLHTRGINVILFTGVNTNSCVLASVVRASVLDFAPIVVSDCVDTMDGPEIHEAGLTILRTAFGWVMDRAQVQREIFAELFSNQETSTRRGNKN